MNRKEMIQVTRERANYTTYTKEATYLQEMLDDLERAGDWIL